MISVLNTQKGLRLISVILVTGRSIVLTGILNFVSIAWKSVLQKADIVYQCVCESDQVDLPAAALNVTFPLLGSTGVAAPGRAVSSRKVPSSVWSSGGTEGTFNPSEAMLKSVTLKGNVTSGNSDVSLWCSPPATPLALFDLTV